MADSIRELDRLNRRCGAGRWRKRKGVAKVALADASIVLAVVPWYECQGIGTREFRLKRVLA